MRRRLTQAEFDELTQARDWCAEHGWSGSVEYYRDLLGWLEFEQRLPRSVQREEPREDREEGDRR